MTVDLLERLGSVLGMSHEERAEALNQTGWASDLESDGLATLATFMTAYELPAGTTIFREGDPGSFMLLVIDGSAKVLKEGDDDYDHVLAELYAGSALGEMTLVDGESRSASVITAKKTQILVLSRESFEDLGTHHPRVWGLVLAKLARQLSARLRATSDDLVDVIAATGFEDERY